MNKCDPSWTFRYTCHGTSKIIYQFFLFAPIEERYLIFMLVTLDFLGIVLNIVFLKVSRVGGGENISTTMIDHNYMISS